jgi:hypothetical protein
MKRQLLSTPIPARVLMSWTTSILDNDVPFTMIIETVGCSEGSGYFDEAELCNVSQNSKVSLLKEPWEPQKSGRSKLPS